MIDHPTPVSPDEGSADQININTASPLGISDKTHGAPFGLCVVFAAFFVGFLLTLSVNFGASVVLGGSELLDDYYDGETHDGIVLSRFCDMLFLDPAVRNNIVRYDYLLFGNIPDNDIILGKDGFLFEIRDKEHDYDYIADYVGSNTSEVRMIASDILSVIEMYRAEGIECTFTVIPNTQTVYYNKMPDYFSEISSNTRLSRLTYLIESGSFPTVPYIDMTYALSMGRIYGRVYNNTENSLNSRGAYFVFYEIMNRLPDPVTDGNVRFDIADIEFVARLTAGKELARRVGLENDIRNTTVSLTHRFPQDYTVTDVRGQMIVTSRRESSDTEENACRPLLLKFTNDWDRVLLTDYFSNAVDTVGYSTEMGFVREEIESLRPAAVVIILHENELSLITDGCFGDIGR